MRQVGFGALLAIVSGLGTMTAHADFIGIYAGASGWVQKTDLSNMPSKSDDKVNGILEVAFEHPVPFIPNGKLRYGQFEYTDTQVTTTTAPFSKVSVKQGLDGKTLDLMAYYEILDNIVSVDAGAGIKRLNLTYSVDVETSGAATGGSSKQETDRKTVPALYVSAGGKLPLTGFSSKAEVFVGKGDHTDFNDLNAEVKYNFINNIALDLGAKLGYRSMMINFDSNSGQYTNKIEVKGPYLGLEAHF